VSDVEEPMGSTPADEVYGESGPVLLAAMRAAGALPAPSDAGLSTRLTGAAKRAGRRTIEVSGGRMTLGWDPDTEGLWSSESTEGLRIPPQPRLVRAFAAALGACWRDPSRPLYPSGAAADTAIVAASLGLSTSRGDEAGVASQRHAKGALVTLQALGLIEIEPETRSVTLGPVVSTWPDHDVELLRQNWSRLPRPLRRNPTPARGRP
jgi:hypothetical protein